MKINSLFWLHLLLGIFLNCEVMKCQERVYDIDDILNMYYQTDAYAAQVADSCINANNSKLFKIRALPTASMAISVPNLNNSILAVTQPDGSDKFVNRFSANTNVSMHISQLIPFTGGTITMSSYITRLDNFNPARNVSYNLNLFNISYSQNLLGMNSYKWDKRILLVQEQVQSIEYIRQRENHYEEIVNLFFDLYIAQEKVDIYQQSLSLSKYLCEKSLKLYSVGKISKEDYINAKIDFYQVMNNNPEAELEYAKSKLMSFLSMKESNFSLGFDYARIINSDLSINIDYICERVAEYSFNTQNKIQELQNDYDLKKIKASGSPSVSLSIGGGLNSQSEMFTQMFGPYNSQMSFGINASIPILSWGKYRLQYKNKKEAIRQTELSYNAQKEAAVVNCRYDLNRLIVLKQSVINNMSMLSLYRQRIDLIKLNVENGKIDVSEIITLRQELESCELHIVSDIKTLYNIVYKYRKMALIDLLNGEVLYP